MKRLVFQDRRGSRGRYTLLVPEAMNTWKMASLCEFLERGTDSAAEAGFLVTPLDPCRHESFRLLVRHCAWTFNSPVEFVQHGKPLGPEGYLDCSRPVNTVMLDRVEGPPPNPRDIRLAQCSRAALASSRQAVTGILDRLFDFERFPIVSVHGDRITSFEALYDDFHNLLDEANQIRVLYRVAQRIHAAPFENMSKILADVPFHSGLEVWRNIELGFGGICAEKTSALKFVCDLLSLPHTHVLGSRSPLPNGFEESLLAYMEARGRQALEHTIYHHFLEVEVAHRKILIDVTNGNIPMLFLADPDSRPFFESHFSARMVYRRDRLYLSRTSDWVGDALLTLSQYHIPGLHYQYVFDQELGLHLSGIAFIGVYRDWGPEQSARIQSYYASLARQARMPYPFFLHAGNLESLPDPSLLRLLKNTLETLRHHGRHADYTGDFTFVLQPLKGHFWSRPRVSPGLRNMIDNWRVDIPPKSVRMTGSESSAAEILKQ